MGLVIMCAGYRHMLANPFYSGKKTLIYESPGNPISVVVSRSAHLPGVVVVRESSPGRDKSITYAYPNRGFQQPPRHRQGAGLLSQERLIECGMYRGSLIFKIAFTGIPNGLLYDVGAVFSGQFGDAFIKRLLVIQDAIPPIKRVLIADIGVVLAVVCKLVIRSAQTVVVTDDVNRTIRSVAVDQGKRFLSSGSVDYDIHCNHPFASSGISGLLVIRVSCCCLYHTLYCCQSQHIYSNYF